MIGVRNPVNFRVTLPTINNTGWHAAGTGNDPLTLTIAPPVAESP
jgi:hypothetical protein